MDGVLGEKDKLIYSLQQQLQESQQQQLALQEHVKQLQAEW